MTLQSSPSDDQGGININREFRQVEVSDGPEYYNNNPWTRLLGRANATEIEIDGKISKAVIDSGAMILMMNKGYCDEHGYEIQSLDRLVPIEGSGGADVPYLGYVEVCIPGIKSFDQDVLMFIGHTITHYHRRVPIQVGSHIIDQVTRCITEEELQSFYQSWKLAYVSTIISKSSQVSDQEFDLKQVKGKVVITKEVKIPAFQTMITEGLMKVMGHQKCIHVLVEPSPKCMTVFVPGNTSELIPRELGITVVLRNLLGRKVTLELHTEVGIVTAANMVPSVQIPNKPDMGENEKIQCMSAQADMSQGTSQRVTESEDILQKIDLSGINSKGAIC